MSFDVEAATAAYIDGLGDEALAQAAAYTTGNQWLMLWGLLIGAIVTLIIIRTGWLTKTAEKLSKRGFVLRVFSISAVYLVVSELLEMPWSIFSGWWRETQYGRTSQPLMDFLGQGLLALARAALRPRSVSTRHRKGAHGWYRWPRAWPPPAAACSSLGSTCSRRSPHQAASVSILT